MKQPTHSQQWYDRLYRIYNIGDFPPLHSFSFTDWHWINDDDLEKDRSFKVIPLTSLPNDYWTMIMDDEDEQPPSRILYSDAVRRSSPANAIFRSSTLKWRNSNSDNVKKTNKIKRSGDADAASDEEQQDDLWFQYKNNRHYQQRQRVVKRSLKPKTSSSARSCLGNSTHVDKKNDEQKKGHVRKLTHRRKSPIRLVRHQIRHCAHRHH